MVDEPTQSTPRVYALLAREPNAAVDAALVESLPELEPELQAVAVDLVVTRGHESGLAALVGGFAAYNETLKDLVCAHVEGLYAGARVALEDERLEWRIGAIELIRRSGDCRLAYLLAEGLRSGPSDRRTRERAAAALQAMTAEHITRRAGRPPSPEHAAEIEIEGGVSGAGRCTGRSTAGSCTFATRCWRPRCG